MFELIFIDRETGRVNYAITGVMRVRYITPSEVGFDKDGRSGSASFAYTEKLEVERVTHADPFKAREDARRRRVQASRSGVGR